MFKLRILVSAIVALAMGGTLVSLTGCGGSGGGSMKPAPPTIGKAFGASTIPLNGSTTLTFNLSNPNAGTTLTGVGFTDSLPAGMVVSTTNGLTGSCGGGTITATAGSGSVSLSGAALSGSASCSFSVNVTGISSGTQNNTTSAVTSNQGGNGNTASASITVSASTGKIQHVVVIFQENRSTDNLFQDPVLISRGADIAQSGKDSHGNTIPLQQLDITANFNPAHGHHAFIQMCDLNPAGQCRMDGADLIQVTCPLGVLNCVFSYVNPAQVAPYFQMAETYTFADHMFQTNQGPSFPAHQFIISGTSAPCSSGLPCPGTGSNLFAAENSSSNGPPSAGCDAAPVATVGLIDQNGNESSYPAVYPCFDHPTLTDLLEANGNTWRYYTSSGYKGGSGQAIWIGPEAIQHICGPNAPPPNGTACVGTDWTNNVILDQTQILKDISNNQLPDVSWVIPTGQASDHPGLTDGSGPSWVASVVNAIGNSPYWADTAIFITWDDWGGVYDHVPPPQVLVNCTQWGCGYVYGFRVPLIVVSPYAKAKYISTTPYVHDFGSILHFVEKTFNLPSLGYADAVADDFSDCFDFNQPPLPFQTIPAALKAEYFLNNKTPPTDPDDD